MTATPGGATELPLLTAPLGKSATTTLTITNPLAVEAAFAAAVEGGGAAAGGSAAARQFSVAPAAFALAPYASTDLTVRCVDAGPARRCLLLAVSCCMQTAFAFPSTHQPPAPNTNQQPQPKQVRFNPGSLGVEDHATLSISSAAAGTVTYALTGKGLLPGEGEQEAVTEVVAALGKPSTKVRALAGALCALLCWCCAFLVLYFSGAVLFWCCTFLVLYFSGAVLCCGCACGLFVRVPCESLAQPTDHPTPRVQVIAWTNPLPTPVTVKVCLDSTQQGLFALGPVPGAAPVPTSSLAAASQQPQQQQQPSPAALNRTPRATAAAAAVCACVPPAQPTALITTVAASSSLQLPVCFCPSLLKEAAAVVTVELLDASVVAPGPLVWSYPIKGSAQADTKGVTFT